MDRKKSQRFVLESNLTVAEQKTIDQWILSQESGSWFHTSEAFRIVWLATPQSLVVRNSESGQMVAAFNFVVKRRAGIKYPVRHPLLYFSSPVTGQLPNADEKVVTELIRQQFDFVNWYFGWRNAPYPLDGGTAQTGLLLDIHGDTDSIIRSMSELARRQLKKKLSGEMVWISPAELTTDELSLLEQSYGSHGKKTPVSNSQLSEILGRMNSNCLALRYQKDGKTLAWRLWIIDQRGWMTDWLSAINKQEAEPHAGYHLMIESIRKAKELGMESLDLGGGNTPGIADFKLKFKPEQRFGYSIVRAKSFYSRLLLALNELKRKTLQKI